VTVRRWNACFGGGRRPVNAAEQGMTAAADQDDVDREMPRFTERWALPVFMIRRPSETLL